MDFDPLPVTLQGRHARLEPLAPAHVEDLHAAGADQEIWRYMPVPPPKLVEDTRRWIDAALEAAGSGMELPFAIVATASGRAVGSTRLLDIQRPHRTLEIGWTWIGREHQRTALNTECKLLLLSHAFDTLGALRVQLKTDGRNTRSQAAIARLGAVREGVLRSHRHTWDGFVRDTVYYSVLAPEWPAVRARLVARLDGQHA